MSRWILLRGLTRESRHWGDFAATFEAQVPGAQVTALDLPGNGRLHELASPTRVAAMAAAARAELMRCGILPPYHLLAMSLGGMVATAWAAAHADQVAACVLVNTSMRPFSPIHHRLRPVSAVRLLRLVLGNGGDASWEQAILAATSRRSHSPGLLAQWMSYRRDAPVSRANALRQLLAAARFKAPRAKPAAEVLVLASAADGLVDPRCSQRLAAAWRCEIAMHPTAGHDLPLDDPAWVVQQVVTWLRGQTSKNTVSPSP